MTILLVSVPKDVMLMYSSMQAAEFVSRLCSSAESRAASSSAPRPFSGQLCPLPVGLTRSREPQPFSSS